MESFPSNSHKSRDDQPQEKKVEKVVQGSVTTRKKPLGSRFAELFISGDSTSVGQYVFLDVILPAIKDMVSDAAARTVEGFLYGESRSPASRRSSRPAGSTGPGGHVSYNRYSSNTPQQRQISQHARANHNFEEIILDSRHEAQEVLDRMFGIIEKYDNATVTDLFDLVGLTSNFADEKWGWTDLAGAQIRRVNGGGYLVDMPKPVPI